MPKKSVRSAARKTSHSAKARQPLKTARRRANRPLHIRISLHPVSLMVALCAGVFLVFSTIGTFGDDYSVTATVPADLLTTPAVITDPVDGLSTATQSLTASGTCPDNSYVTLTDNTTIEGTAWCTGQTFSITFLLQSGANQLLAQDYNVINQPGPFSGPTNVTYTPPAQPQPPVVVEPDTLTVIQVDSGVPYVSQGTIQDTSSLPTFSGVAPPFARVTLLVHSNPIICTTTAAADGYWKCTLPTALPAGLHTVDISAVTTGGQTLRLPQFKVRVGSKHPAAAAATGPLTILSPYQYQATLLNQQLSITGTIIGGQTPYALSVDWGDGQTQTISVSSTFTLTHSYSKTTAGLQSFTVKIQAVDTAGRTTSLQLITLIRDPNYHAPAAVTKQASGIQDLLSTVHSWLWLLWPAYLIVVLMLVSFWLGERKQYADDRRKKLKLLVGGKHHKRRHA